MESHVNIAASKGKERILDVLLNYFKPDRNKYPTILSQALLHAFLGSHPFIAIKLNKLGTKFTISMFAQLCVEGEENMLELAYSMISEEDLIEERNNYNICTFLALTGDYRRFDFLESKGLLNISKCTELMKNMKKVMKNQEQSSLPG